MKRLDKNLRVLVSALPPITCLKQTLHSIFLRLRVPFQTKGLRNSHPHKQESTESTTQPDVMSLWLFVCLSDQLQRVQMGEVDISQECSSSFSHMVTLEVRSKMDRKKRMSSAHTEFNTKKQQIPTSRKASWLPVYVYTPTPSTSKSAVRGQGQLQDLAWDSAGERAETRSRDRNRAGVWERSFVCDHSP